MDTALEAPRTLECLPWISCGHSTVSRARWQMESRRVPFAVYSCTVSCEVVHFDRCMNGGCLLPLPYTLTVSGTLWQMDSRQIDSRRVPFGSGVGTRQGAHPIIMKQDQMDPRQIDSCRAPAEAPAGPLPLPLPQPTRPFAVAPTDEVAPPVETSHASPGNVY